MTRDEWIKWFHSKTLIGNFTEQIVDKLYELEQRAAETEARMKVLEKVTETAKPYAKLSSFLDDALAELDKLK